MEQYPHYQDQDSIDDAKMQLDALLVNGLKQVLLDEINEIVEAIESKGYDDELLNIIREDVSNLRKTIDAEDYKVVLEALLDSLNIIDTSALEAKLLEAKATESESYTPETYETLQVIIKEAETVLTSPESQEAVDRAVLALDAAIAQLVFIEENTEIPEIPDEEAESPEIPDEESESPDNPDENDEVGIPNEPDQDTEGRLPVTGVSSNPWGVLFILAGLLTLIEVQRRREK